MGSYVDNQQDFHTHQSLLAALQHAAAKDEGIFTYPPGKTERPEFAQFVGYEKLLRIAKNYAGILGKKLEWPKAQPQPDSQPHRPVIMVHFDSILDTVEWYWAVMLWGGIPAITSPAMFSHNEADGKAHLAHLATTLDSPLCLTRHSLMGPFMQHPDAITAYAIEDLVVPTGDCITAGSEAKFASMEVVPNGSITIDPQLKLDDIAALMLTSGSSGSAKAVPITHGQILVACEGKNKNADLKFPKSPFLSWVGIDHVANLVHCHLFAIISGVSQIHLNPADAMADPVHFLNILSRHNVSRTFAPNFFLSKLRRLLEAGRVESLDPDLNLEALYLDSGGEANVVEVCVAVQSLLEPYGAPENVISPSFGMTETCAGCIFNNCCPTYDQAVSSQFASLGKPMSGVSMRIAQLGSDLGTDSSAVSQTAKPGERGHLQVAGPAVFKGYFGNPQATNMAFTSDGWFQTGDLAYLDDNGNLHLDGRIKELININGVKYLPHELDSALEQAEIPGTTPSYFCCFSIREPNMDTEEVLVVFLPSHTLGDSDEDDERRFETHARISIVTSLHTHSRPRVLPLRADQLQKSTLGKLSRAKLKDAFDNCEFAVQQANHNKAIQRHRQRTRGTPANEREAIVLNIIRSQLDLGSEDDFSVNDSLLLYGSTSMDLMTIKSRINGEKARLNLSRPLDLIDLLHDPSPRGIVSRIDASSLGHHAYDPVVVLQPHGAKPPLWVVHPGVGEVLVFVALARQINDRPLYAFRARGFNKGETPFSSLEELFETYHSAIKSRQPEGPYAIAGYSFGGMVAFELAKLLESEGDEVRVCAPFNLPPHIKWRMRELVWDECVMHLFYFVELMGEEEVYAHKSTICRLGNSGPEGQLDAIKYLKPYCDQARWDELGLNEEDYLHWVSIASNMQGLAVDYEPSGSIQGMDVFVADPLSHVAKTREEWINNRLSAWKDFVKNGDVRFHNVQGAHYTMLNPKFVDVSTFAGTLKKVLAQRGI